MVHSLKVVGVNTSAYQVRLSFNEMSPNKDCHATSLTLVNDTMSPSDNSCAPAVVIVASLATLRLFTTLFPVFATPVIVSPTVKPSEVAKVTGS